MIVTWNLTLVVVVVAVVAEQVLAFVCFAELDRIL
jgi:hypothetical protein